MAEKKEKRITSRPYGRVQKVRGRRKLFGKARQGVFLRKLAATCNVAASAAAAGVTAQCVYQRRAGDVEFRERWGVAVEEGYAALELRLLEAAMGRGGEGGGDDWHEPSDGEPPHPSPLPAGEREALDKDLALHLLREHKRERGARRESPPALRGASWGEVEDYFMARLRALRVRIDGDEAQTHRVDPGE